MSEDEVLFEQSGDIGLVTFNRPQARNALTFAMYDALAAICERVAEDGGVRALVLTGAGDKAFAAGTDIAQFRDFRTADDALAYEQHMSRVLNTVDACPVPTIAAIRGACTGGGAAIAAACDLRIASTDLKFGMPIARTLGNCLSSDNLMRLVALIGEARTRELIFTARLVGADEALRLGLVNEVTEADVLLARANELAQTVAGHAPLTLRVTKEALRRMRAARISEYDDLITLCYTSEDFREGMNAFLEKRAPKWRGK